jgi:hypothetical protein
MLSEAFLLTTLYNNVYDTACRRRIGLRERWWTQP